MDKFANRQGSRPTTSKSGPSVANEVDRRMIRSALLGSHSHWTADKENAVHIYQRDGKYLARGRYQGSAFGVTLGKDVHTAGIKLHELIVALNNGSFVRSSEAQFRPLSKGKVPRLTPRELVSEYISMVRKQRGQKTANTYMSRLSRFIDFVERKSSLQRWPLVSNLDEEFVREFRAYLFSASTTRNGRSGGRAKPLSPRQVHNELGALRTLLSWALKPQVRKLPVEFVNPVTNELVGSRPRKDPMRAITLPVERRIELVQHMDPWQLMILCLSMVLPLRPDEACGLLVEEVDFASRRLRFGTRFEGRDFTKGKQSFMIPYPEELDHILRACIAGRASGPLLRRRSIVAGRENVEWEARAQHDLEQALAQALTENHSKSVLSEQDGKQLIRRRLRELGGLSPDQLSLEFKKVAGKVGLQSGIRFYDTRAAVTTEMNRAGVPERELRYMTGHSAVDIMDSYVSVDIDAAMQRYFKSIHSLLETISSRAESTLTGKSLPATSTRRVRRLVSSDRLDDQVWGA